MPELEDAPWLTPDAAAGPKLEAAPWLGKSANAVVGASHTAPEASGLASRLASPVTGIPHEAYHATADALSATNDYLNPFSESVQKGYKEKANKPWYSEYTESGPGTLLGTGKGLLAAASVPFMPFTGAARSLIGRPLSAVLPTATPEQQKRLRDAGIPDRMIAGATSDENFEKFGKGAADTALMGLGPRGGSPVGPRSVPVPPAPTGPLGVALSEGQRTGELPLIQREQAALRGQSGEAVQRRAQEFADQQRTQLETAGENVSRQLDPYGMQIVETPQQAGQLVSEGVRDAASQSKAGVTQAYDYAKSLPGEIHADAFSGIGDRIKTDLSMGPEPVIIDDRLTPFASRAIQDVESRISQLQIQNRADPLGQPSPQSIVGVDLAGVDQMRKRLVSFRRDAYASGNAADGRAASEVVKAFDNQIDGAVNGGLFNGDRMAIDAWNDARAAHADHKSTFSAGKNDPVGRVIEKITGKGNNPAAIPNDVADFLYGGTGVNPGSLNVNVARRVRGILGEQSPEWSAVKQGLFARITDAGPGVTDWGPGKVAQRVNKFLNVDGVELSREVFTPADRALIQAYGDLNRSIQVPQAGANWSNTSTVLGPMIKKISGGVAAIVGGVVGHLIAPGMHGAAEGLGAAGMAKASSAFGEARTMRQIREQMPLVAEATQRFSRAVAMNSQYATPMSARVQGVAAANLARSLQGIGLDPVAIFGRGAVPAHAEEKK